MGGYGSGSWYRLGKRDTTDDHHSLDIRLWHRQRLLKPGYIFTTTWSQGERRTGSISVRVVSRELIVLEYRSRSGGEWQKVSEPVSIDWTPCTFGGERPWFWCPGAVNGRTCGRRVAVLYGAGKYFLCRHCCDLTYECQREQVFSRALRRAQKIRRRLGGSESMITPFPPKPKRMRWQTYSGLWQAHDEANWAHWMGLKAWLERPERWLERLLRC